MLTAARPTSGAIRAAVDRVAAALAALPVDSGDAAIAATVDEAAREFVAQVAEECAALVDAGAASMLRGQAGIGAPPGDAAPLELLTLGTSGALSGGGCGTALGIIGALARARPGTRAWIAETRPALLGSRIGAVELVAQGVPVTVIADGAIGALLATRRIDAAIVPAERLGADGDVLGVAGTATLAAVAAHHGVPLVVAAPGHVRDAPGTVLPPLPLRPATDLLPAPGGERAGIAGADAWVPLLDRTPAALVAAVLDERGAHPPGG
jgi:methylthioribose-1-phosphate isomerase